MNETQSGMLRHPFFNMRDCFILLPVITVFAHFVSAPELKSLPVAGTSEARDSKRAGCFKEGDETNAKTVLGLQYKT